MIGAAFLQTRYSNVIPQKSRIFFLYFDKNFTEVCSEKSIWQDASIGWDNGLANTRNNALHWNGKVPSNM